MKRTYSEDGTAPRGFSNPVEPTVTYVSDGPSSTAPPGIAVTKTNSDGDTITTTFEPITTHPTALDEETSSTYVQT